MNVLGHGELVADTDAGVEPVDGGGECGERGSWVLRGANDEEKVVTRTLVDGEIDGRAEGIVEPALADVVDDSDDLMERARERV